MSSPKCDGTDCWYGTDLTLAITSAGAAAVSAAGAKEDTGGTPSQALAAVAGGAHAAGRDSGNVLLIAGHYLSHAIWKQRCWDKHPTCNIASTRHPQWTLSCPQRPYPNLAGSRQMCELDRPLNGGLDGYECARAVHTFRFGVNLVAFSAFGRLKAQSANAWEHKLHTAPRGSTHSTARAHATLAMLNIFVEGTLVSYLAPSSGWVYGPASPHTTQKCRGGRRGGMVVIDR